MLAQVRIKIKDLLEKINFPLKKIQYKKSFNQEVDISIANLSNYKKLQNFKFKKVENFLKLIENLNYFSENLNKLYPNEANTFIYGAGFAGKRIAKDLITKNQNLLYFIDDNKKDWQVNIWKENYFSRTIN